MKLLKVLIDNDCDLESAAFDIAHEIESRGKEVPSHWEFDSNGNGPNKDSYIATEILPTYTTKQLIATGNVIIESLESEE